MKKEVYKGAVNGDVSILTNNGKAELQSLTLENNNIIHIAAKHGQAEFILVAIKKLAKAEDFLVQRNIIGDTPLHVAARHGHEAAAELVAANGPAASLAMVQNEDGDTPLHVALKYRHLQLARALSQSSQALSVLNRSKETPFHLFIKCLPISLEGEMQQPTPPTYQNWKQNSEGGESSQAAPYQPQFEDSFIRHLLSSYKDAACLRDAEGFTPLLRAARCGFFRVLETILEICPECVEVFDSKGKTVLHHALLPNYSNQLKELLKVPEIAALKNVRDCEGNTPAHLAAKTGDLTLLTVLYESMADFSLKNNEDLSVEQIIEPHGGFSGKMEMLMYSTTIGKWMETELYVASTLSGDVTIFEKKDTTTNINGIETTYDDEYYMSRTSSGSTILHLAIQNGHSNFVKKTLEHFPSLVLSRDFNGDTALHDAARRKARGVRAMVRICVRCMRNIANMNLDNVVHNSPWKAKNSKGNNALHEAMRTSNHKIIEELFKVDPSLALDKNNIGETPLHVFAKYATYTVDDTLDIIRHMLGSNADSAYQKDADGLTPAMRAAKYGRIRVAGLILQTLPQSIDVRDSNGRTFLHLLNIMHLELVDAAEDTTALCQILFFFPGVDSLRTAQDRDGNTPLHLALKTRNFVTAKVLMQRCLQSKMREELNIINGDGHSIFNLLSSLQANKSDDKEFEAMALLSIKIKERTSLENTMEIELYEAVVEGDVEIFDDYKDDVEGEYESEDRSYFMAQTPDGSSIVHTALKMGEKNTEAFLEEALNQFPSLICRRDYNGDTPLHLAAKWSSLASTKLLWLAVKSFSQAVVENTQHVTGVVLPPWMVKNSQGNMPIHEAIINGNIYAAEFLNNADPEAASYVNEAGETALHVYARCGQYSFQDKLEFLERLIEKNISAAHIRDNEGLTPLLRSAKCGKFRVAQTILKHCPLSAQLYDPKGRNFLHLLRLDVEFGETSFDVVYIMLSKQLFEVPEVDALRTEQDRDGNAPLQYALKTGNFVTAKVLAQRCCKNEFIREFHLVNNENERLEDLLRSTETPTEIVKLFRKKVPSFVSSYGIRKTEIKDSVNSLSVIAALLATMTFAAALQVPGGFNSEEGTPVLLTRSAFQVFLVADIVAMCGSMLVLFCLLWVLGTGKTADSLILIDFAFFLLQGSFYATLLAFMTGVYVYTVGKTSWVAIFVCVLCSTVMLLSWKTSILFLTKSIRLVINGVMNLRTRSFKDIVAIGTTLFFGNETSDDESGDDESRPQQQQQQQQQQPQS